MEVLTQRFASKQKNDGALKALSIVPRTHERSFRVPCHCSKFRHVFILSSAARRFTAAGIAYPPSASYRTYRSLLAAAQADLAATKNAQEVAAR